MRFSGLLAGLGLAAVGVASLTGCAGERPTAAATPAAAPTRDSGPLADPDSPRRVVYDERLVSDPLPASKARAARSTMSAAEAVRAGTRSGVSPDQQPGPPSASLRLVTARPASGAQASAKPTWVLTWRNSAPAVRGPATMTESERRAIADSLECVFVVTVDPESGAATNAAQFCERK